jgi:methyl-accepting chemotaxis protein
MNVKMGRSRLNRKLLTATGLVIGAVLVGSIFSCVKILESRRISANVVKARLPLLDAIRNIRQNSYRSTSLVKSYLLFGSDPAAGEKYKRQRADCWQEIDKAVAKIHALEGLYDYGDERIAVDEALHRIAVIRTLQDQAESLAVGHGGEATGKAYDLVGGELTADENSAVGAITDAVHLIQGEYNAQMETMDRSASEEITVLWVSTLLGALIGGLFSSLLARRIVRSIQSVVARAQSIANGDLTGEPLDADSGDEIAALAVGVNEMQANLGRILQDMTGIAETVNGASVRLAGSTRTNLDRTAEQSTQTRTVADSIIQLSSSISAVSLLAESGVASAQQAAETAREGGAIVAESLGSMNSIAESVRSTASTIQRLGKESEQIIHIVRVIEDIAAKTNLLALNAAIEAARAGEQGRGFAVVAGEVRRLAESTHGATGEISRMVESIRQHTLAAVEAMDAGTLKVEAGVATTVRAGDALNRIIEMAGNVDEMIGQIASTSSAQAGAALNSTASLEVISRLSADATAAIPETQQVVDAMEVEVERLRAHISHFQLGATVK